MRKIGILAGSKLKVIYLSALESIRPMLNYLKGHQVYKINSNVAYFKRKILCISYNKYTKRYSSTDIIQ